MLAGNDARNAAPVSADRPRAQWRLGAVSHVRRALRAGRRPRDRLLDAHAADHLRRPVVRDVLRAGRQRPRDVRPAARTGRAPTSRPTSSTRRTCGCPRGNGARSRTARSACSIRIRRPTRTCGSPTTCCKPDACGRSRRYTQLGTALAAQIVKQEVVDLPGLGPMLLPGPQGFQSGRCHAPESELSAARRAARARARRTPAARGHARRQRLQAHQDDFAARLRARLGGVQGRPVRRRSEERRHRQL